MRTQNQVKRTAIFRALQLAELLCSIPAIRAFKKTYPQAQLTLIGMPWAHRFAERFSHYFTDFIAFPGYPGLTEEEFDATAFEAFSMEMQNRGFDLLIQMQDNGTILNPLLKTFGAAELLGFTAHQDYNGPHERWLKYPDEQQEIDRNLALMAFDGIYSEDNTLEFPLYPADYDELSMLSLPLEDGKYICIHPGARENWKQWPPLYFAAIADYCHLQGYEVVLTGTTAEMPVVKQVDKLMQSTPIIAAGRTSLGSLAALMAKSAAIICNYTGVAHLAAALKTPAVAISMDGDVWRWAAKNTEIQRVIDWSAHPDYQEVLKETAALFFRL